MNQNQIIVQLQGQEILMDRALLQIAPGLNVYLDQTEEKLRIDFLSVAAFQIFI